MEIIKIQNSPVTYTKPYITNNYVWCTGGIVTKEQMTETLTKSYGWIEKFKILREIADLERWDIR